MRRKYFVIIIILATLIVTYIIHSIFFSDKLTVVVFNKTNYDIDSLLIGKKVYKIKQGDSLLISDCKSLSMQSGLPFGLPTAIIKGLTKDTTEIVLCGTGVKSIKNGDFKFDITSIEFNKSYTLFWGRHK